MRSLQFWTSWEKSNRVIFWTLTSLTVVALVFFWVSWFVQPAPVITLDHYQQLQRIESTSHSFQIGLNTLNVPTANFLVFENIFGSNLQPNTTALYFFITCLACSFVVLITIFSTLSRSWFLVGMGLAILFLASLRFDTLEIFGLSQQVAIAVLALIYCGPAYYLNAFRSDVTFVRRMLVFVLITLVVAVAAQFFGRVPMPLLHLAANGLFAGIIVCLIFILMFAHEIVASFVTLTTQNLRSPKSLQHFLVLTVVYLVNLALMFASKMGFVSWDFFAVNSFFVMTVTIVLGLWGFRQRSVVYEHILSDEPLGTFFFLSTAVTTVATMSWFAASASDIMMDALDDVIMAAHIGCGIIFLLYTIANFGPMLVKNLAVYKVLYKPETMPHFTYRLMAIIGSYAVLSTGVSWKTYVNQATASFYNAHGDVYLAQGDIKNAEALYTKSTQFRNQNLHAHYGLASIYSIQFDGIRTKKEFEKSIDWSPSVPVFLNLSEAYATEGHVLEAALKIDDGKKTFPKSGEMMNAAGLSFLRLKIADSALFYFQQAQKVKSTRKIAETNFLGASALFGLNVRIDSILSLRESKTSGSLVNRIAYANIKQRSLVFEGKLDIDTALSVYQAALLCNYLVNQKADVDTSLISQTVSIAGRPSNAGFRERLLVSAATALYAKGEVSRALRMLREAAFRSGDAAEFFLMGLWLLEQNNPLAASGYFKTAAEKQHALALYYQAIAETEADSLTQAFAKWDSLSHTNEKKLAASAAMMKTVLLSKDAQISSLNDEEKYYYCRHKIALEDSLLLERTAQSITDENLRARALYDRSRKWYSFGENGRARRLLSQTTTTNKKLSLAIDQLNVMLAAEHGDWNYVGKKINGGLQVPFNERVYLEALQAQQSGNVNEAAPRFRYLLSANSQFEEGVVAAARFFAADTTDQMKNFSLLVDGLAAKPDSPKVLEQHVLMCVALSLVQEAQDSLDKLRAILPNDVFKKFIKSHPDLFGEK